MKNRRLNDEQKRLLSRNFNLVHKYYKDSLKKKDIPQRMEDEFFSHLMERFCYSALSYNPESGFKFSTYAYGGFGFGKREIIAKAMRARFVPQKQVKERIDRWHSNDRSETAIQWDSVARGRTSALKAEKVWEIVEEVDLTQMEKEVVELYFSEGYSCSKLGKKFSRSKEGLFC